MISTQLRFKLRSGDYSEDFLEAAAYASAAAAFAGCHKGTAWIWEDLRLVTRAVPEGMSESSHWELFGSQRAHRAMFRGWCNGRTVVVQSRDTSCKHVNELPTRLMEHLLRRFKVPWTAFRLM